MAEGASRSDIVIHAPRLMLRRPTLADVADVHAIFSDPDVMTYWSSGAHASPDETRDWLLPVIQDPQAYAYGLFLEHDGRIIGKLGCWKLPEIGVALHKAYWGRGLAREALAAFIDYMAQAGACDHLFADIDPRNQRSIALLERCGFQKCGEAKNTMETHIGWCDSVYYRLDFSACSRSKASSS